MCRRRSPWQYRRNVYVCEVCRSCTPTIDRDSGVTPFAIRCPGCGGSATSSFYRVPQTIRPFLEWYRPHERERRRLDAITLDHVRRGGLLLRPIR